MCPLQSMFVLLQCDHTTEFCFRRLSFSTWSLTHWNNAISKSNDKLFQEQNLLEIIGIYDIIRKCTATLKLIYCYFRDCNKVQKKVTKSTKEFTNLKIAWNIISKQTITKRSNQIPEINLSHSLAQAVLSQANIDFYNSVGCI